MGGAREQVENELADFETKIARAQQSYDSKLNNVKAVKGADFEEQVTFSQIMCEVESMKSQHMLNAIS